MLHEVSLVFPHGVTGVTLKESIGWSQSRTVEPGESPKIVGNPRGMGEVISDERRHRRYRDLQEQLLGNPQRQFRRCGDCTFDPILRACSIAAS